MIICAAIKISKTILQDTLVVCGYRHGDCINTINNLDEYWRDGVVQEQGFINHNGEFLNREEAYNHALECGQIHKHNEWYRSDNELPDELYSEDLY